MFLRIASQIGLITLPGMAALVATSDQTVNLIFGPGWHEIVPIFAWLGLAGLLQPTTSAVVWLLVAQGRTTTMLRWGLYSSTTTIASFVIGLRWGAAGVACAYAVSEYVVRLPVVYVLVSRVGPITAIDLARIQVPLLAAAGLSALFVMTVLRQRFGLEGLPLVSAAVLVSYGTAITLMAVQPRSRSALYATFLLFWQLGRRIRPA
jgi:O-antigen/teichoic acid export membrane protein